MPLPLFKLGALLAKQISKPLAKILKDKAKMNETFRTYFVIPTANVYHNIDITLRMRVLGLGSPDKVPPLTEKAAIELGGDILSEFFVFGVAVSLIMFEYLRQSTNKTNKDNAMISKVDELEANYTQLVKTNEANEKRMADMAKFAQEQKNKINELVDRLNKIDQFKAKKFSAQESQTTANGRPPIGKIMHPSDSKTKASEDVTNSVLYQSAELASSFFKSFSK